MLYSQKSMFLMGLLSALSPSVMGMKRPIAGSSSLRRRLPRVPLGQIFSRALNPNGRDRSSARRPAHREPARLPEEPSKTFWALKDYVMPGDTQQNRTRSEESLVDRFLNHKKISDEEFQRRMVISPLTLLNGRVERTPLHRDMEMWCRDLKDLGRGSRPLAIGEDRFNHNMITKFFKLHFKKEPWLISFSEEATQEEWKAHWTDDMKKYWLKARFQPKMGTILNAGMGIFQFLTTKHKWRKPRSEAKAYCEAKAAKYAELVEVKANRIPKEELSDSPKIETSMGSKTTQEYTKMLYRRSLEAKRYLKPEDIEWKMEYYKVNVH